jgi:hypothetical protein
MIKRILAVLAFYSLVTAASAQSVQQFGTVTANHATAWVTNGVIKDGGSSAESSITSFGVTNNGGSGICVNSDHASAAGRNQLCLSASTTGSAILSLQNYGTAAPQSLQFNINGTVQGFPTIASLPVVAGNSVCFNNTSGALKDCGSSPTTVPLTIGTTPVNSGTTNGLLYNNAGLLGNLATVNSGVLVTNGSGVPSISTTLPNSLALGTPGSGTLTNATGLPISTGVSGLGTNVAAALANTLNATGGVVGFSGALGTPASGVATNLTGTASGLTAGTVTTNANLTGDITSLGNATTYNNVVPANKGGAGTISGALKANGSGTVTQAACADLSNGTSVCSAAVGQLPATITNDNAAAGKVGEYVNATCPAPGTTATVTITIASPGVVTWTAHGISNSFGGGVCPVVFTTTGALPTGLTAGVTVYTVPSSITTNTFQVATSVENALAGTSINTSGTQSGTQTGTINRTLANQTGANITGISLTAGDWDVFGQVINAPAGTTVYTLLIAGVSTSTGAISGAAGTPGRSDCAYGAGLTGGSQDGCAILPTRFSLSSTQTIFLVTNDAFTTSTMTASGSITARRMR